MTLFFVSSCIKENVEEATLSLSEEGTLEVSKQSSEQSINVTTNQESWNSFVNVDWIELEQDINFGSITMFIKENTGVTDRKAELLVLAGSASQKISIIQSASAVEFKLSEEEASIDQWGGEITVDVSTNSINWNVEQQVGTEEWLTVQPKTNSGVILIKVAENKDKNGREAAISIVDKSTRKTKDFIVKQDGIMYYTLPLLEPMATEGKIVEFENSKRSLRLLDTAFLNNRILTFETKNPLFPYVQYIMGETYADKMVVFINDPDFFVDQEFFNMFEKDGYEFHSSDEISKKYTKKKTIGKQPFVITLDIVKSAQMGITGAIYVGIIPLEPEGMTTYSELLLGYTEFNGITKEKIAEWESSHNGTYDKASSIETPDANGKTSYSYTAPSPYYYRTYVFRKGIFSTSWLLFRDVNKFYYEFDGKYYMIDDFYTLLKSNGYEAIGTDSYGFDCFDNTDEDKRLEIRAQIFEGFAGSKPMIDMYLRPIPKSGASSSVKISAFEKSENYIKTTLTILNK
jgi:hypothetical protein